MTITITDLSPEDQANGQAYLAYTDAVTEASGGRIQFEFHWAGSLLTAAETPEGIAAGIADMGIVLPATHASLTPVANWLFDAGHLPSDSFPVGTLQGQGAHAEAVFGSEELRGEFSDLGLEVLAPIYSIQNFDAFCTKPVTTLEEARGVTIRTGSETYAHEVAALGMEAVNVPPEEVYEAFQRGVVDCMNVWPPTSIVWGLWDVGQHYMPIQFTGYNAFYLTMNQEMWEGLDPEAQQILWDHLPLFLRTYHETNLDQYRQWATEGRQEKGIEFHPVSSDLQSALSEFQEQRFSTMADSAPSRMTDAQAFLDEYVTIMDKWLGIVTDELGYAVFDRTPEDLINAYTAEWDLDEFEAALAERVYDPNRP